MTALSSLKSAFLTTPLLFQMHQLPLDAVEVSLVSLHLHLCLQPLAVCRRAADGGKARQTAAQETSLRRCAVAVDCPFPGRRQMSRARPCCPNGWGTALVTVLLSVTHMLPGPGESLWSEMQ